MSINSGARQTQSSRINVKRVKIENSLIFHKIKPFSTEKNSKPEKYIGEIKFRNVVNSAVHDFNRRRLAAHEKK